MTPQTGTSKERPFRRRRKDRFLKVSLCQLRPSNTSLVPRFVDAMQSKSSSHTCGECFAQIGGLNWRSFLNGCDKPMLLQRRSTSAVKPENTGSHRPMWSRPDLPSQPTSEGRSRRDVMLWDDIAVNEDNSKRSMLQSHKSRNSGTMERFKTPLIPDKPQI